MDFFHPYCCEILILWKNLCMKNIKNKIIRCAGCYKELLYDSEISICEECEKEIYQKPSFGEKPNEKKNERIKS